MNTYHKLNGTWTIATDAQDNVQAGSTVTVSLRNGSQKQVTLAHLVRTAAGFGGHILRYFAIAEQPRPAAEAVGDLSGIFALFARAQRHLRYPAIVLQVPGTTAAMRISVAGPRASAPGSITVTSEERAGDGRRAWYGRVQTTGAFEPGRAAPTGVAEALRRFAVDPAGVAAEHGRLTGRCCFCNHRLDDERSTAVGYGPVCADHYGLPWGSRAAAPASFQALVEQVAASGRRVAAPIAPADASDIVARYAAAVAAGQLLDEPTTVAQMASRLRAIEA